MSGGRWIVGIDEAGRGSIVGEMIVAAIAVPVGEERLLAEELGVRDSKMLTPQARMRIYRALSRAYPFAAVPVTPREIDEENLNKLTAQAAVRAVKLVASRVGGWDSISEVIVDRFGDPARLIVLLRLEGYRGPVRAEEKADARYPVVGAASIIAKHVRDTRLRVLRVMYGVEGSGYPSDPRTIEWLRRAVMRGELPPIVRRSWETLRGTPFYKPKRKFGGSRVTLEDFF